MFEIDVDVGPDMLEILIIDRPSVSLVVPCFKQPVAAPVLCVKRCRNRTLLVGFCFSQEYLLLFAAQNLMAMCAAFIVVDAAAGPVTRKDLVGVAPRSYERAVAERARLAGLDPRRLAAARVIWRLAQRGDACLVDKVGAEQTYVAPSPW